MDSSIVVALVNKAALSISCGPIASLSVYHSAAIL